MRAKILSGGGDCKRDLIIEGDWCQNPLGASAGDNSNDPSANAALHDSNFLCGPIGEKAFTEDKETIKQVRMVGMIAMLGTITG